ncbi:hypothetical protein ACFVH4_19135 [Nocardia ignorata]|uniref:hypothetical protein n=1 Tax=Nocardia ignorata TaxID=145285 RepID=UPI00363F8B1C
MEPAIVRGLLVAITVVAAAILGREVSTEWVDTVLGIYTLVAPLVAGVLIRRKVASKAFLQDHGFGLPPLGQGGA